MPNRRRPQGDGMIRKRSDGRWEGRIIIGHKNDGTPMYKSVFGKTQKAIMAMNKSYSRKSMFRDLTRKKQKLSLEECKEILKQEVRGVLAVNGDDGYPYALPINFYFDERNNKIYFL
jgi:hypothetical protein